MENEFLTGKRKLVLSPFFKHINPILIPAEGLLQEDPLSSSVINMLVYFLLGPCVLFVMYRFWLDKKMIQIQTVVMA